MARATHRRFSLDTLVRVRRLRRVQSMATLGIVTLGPVLAFASYIILGPFDQGTSSPWLKLILLLDFIYVLSLTALISTGVVRMILARRAKKTGSQLHRRLTAAFTLLALLPTVLLAIFAVLVINLAIEAWFSDRVKSVVGNSLKAAQAYETEQLEIVTSSVEALANQLAPQRGETAPVTASDLRKRLSEKLAAFSHNLTEAFILDGEGEVKLRGDGIYKFDFERPTDEALAEAISGGVGVIEDWENNEFRAIIALDAYFDLYLYVSHDVDGGLLNLLDETQETSTFYQQLERDTGRRFFLLALVYLGFAAILILSAMWLGMSFAERLARPIERLASAADRVRSGDLNIQVIEEPGTDELSTLGRAFNLMISDLNTQRGELIEYTEQIEKRRRLFDSVLSSVTAGVIGLDAEGQVTFLNRAAARLLDVDEALHETLSLELLVPEFAPLFQGLKGEGRSQVQEELGLTRMGKQERLLVRIARRYSDEGRLEGFVIAFDDVTNLVSAQRMAAWGDVARRIAHEIKNPLTPIQLSAERIKRKFGRKLDEEDATDLENLTGVIIRQTEDLRRIVDEFSKFARMPEPIRKPANLAGLVRDAVTLQKAGQVGVAIDAVLAQDKVPAEIDETMIGQALTNLIKNAGEAIETYQEKGAHEGHKPEIRVALELVDEIGVITIADNGIGLPEDRARLFEPYVTTREKGTGLGLPIVKKIIEEHGGTLTLTDAPAFDESGHTGAMALIELPLSQAVLASEAAE
ncbi:MAG: ATP-binding protein [Maritimibacter sp.]